MYLLVYLPALWAVVPGPGEGGGDVCGYQPVCMPVFDMCDRHECNGVCLYIYTHLYIQPLAYVVLSIYPNKPMCMQT